MIRLLLADLNVGFCAVDEPALPGLFPNRTFLVGDVAYVRFHGRNGGDWWTGGPLRYDYNYIEAELNQWTGLIREMAAKAKQTYIFFNNCHAGHAVLNARMMEELLGISRGGSRKIDMGAKSLAVPRSATDGTADT